MSEGSDGVGTTTRRLMREEWKPMGGRRVERFVASPASYEVPGDEWTDDLAGTSEVDHEVIGYCEIRSRRKFPAVAEFSEFKAKIEDESEFVQWLDDWGNLGDETPETSGLEVLFDGSEGTEGDA